VENFRRRIGSRGAEGWRFWVAYYPGRIFRNGAVPEAVYFIGRYFGDSQRATSGHAPLPEKRKKSVLWKQC